MVRSGLRHVQPLISLARAAAIVAAALLLAGCQLLGGRPQLPVQSAAVVDLGSEAVAARLIDGRVEVLVATRGESGEPGAVSTITSSPAKAGIDTLNLLSYGGNTGGKWNTFVYGTASPGVAKVELDLPGGVGSPVVDGAWLIALPDKDVVPDQLHWQFLGADGLTIREGDGLLTLGVAPAASP
jgi:hypothetical protein